MFDLFASAHDRVNVKVRLKLLSEDFTVVPYEGNLIAACQVSSCISIHSLVRSQGTEVDYSLCLCLQRSRY